MDTSHKIPEPECPQVYAWTRFLAAVPHGSTSVAPTLQGTLQSVFRGLTIGNSTLQLKSFDVEPCSVSPADCKDQKSTYAITVTCRVVVRQDSEGDGDGTAVSPSETEMVLRIPAITQWGTFVVHGQELFSPIRRRLAAGAVILRDERLLPTDAVANTPAGKAEMPIGFAVIVSNHFRQVRMRLRDDSTVEVDLGDGNWFSVTLLLRLLGAASERDLLHLFCVEREVTNDFRSAGLIAPLEVLGSNIYWSPNRNSTPVLLHKARTNLFGWEVQSLAEIGATISVYRWRWRIRLSDGLTTNELATVCGRPLASAVIHARTGEVLVPAHACLTGALLRDLRATGIESIELESERSADLIHPLLRTWRHDGVSTRHDAAYAIGSAMGLQWRNYDNVRSHVDAMLTPPKFELVGQGRTRFEVQTGRAASGSPGLNREDIVALIARLVERCHSNPPESQDVDLSTFAFLSVDELLSSALREAVADISPRLWVLQQDVRRAPPKELVGWCEFMVNAGLEAALSQKCFRISERERDLCDGPLRSIVDDEASAAVPSVARIFAQSDLSWYGRVCLIESGSGRNPHVALRLAKYARLRLGALVCPHWKVMRAKVSQDVVWLNSSQEWNEVVAPYGSIGSTARKTACRHRGEVGVWELGKVTYSDIALDHGLSLTTSLVPYLSSSSWHSVKNGACATRSSLRLVHAEVPRVTAAPTGQEIQFKRDRPSVSASDSGVHLRAAYMPWYGKTIRNSVVVSSAVVQREQLESFEVKRFTVNLRPVLRGAALSRGITIQEYAAGSWRDHTLDAAGIVRMGSRVAAGAKLVNALRPSGDGLSPIQALATAVHGRPLIRGTPASVCAPAGLDGIVTDVWIITPSDQATEEMREALAYAIAIERDWIATEAKAIMSGPRSARSDLRNHAGRNLRRAGATLPVDELKLLSDLVEGMVAECDQAANYWSEASRVRTCEQAETTLLELRVERRRPLEVGDILSTRHGGGGTISAIVPAEDMPFMADGSPVDLILSPLTVLGQSRIGELYEAVSANYAASAQCYLEIPLFLQGVGAKVLFLGRCWALRWLGRVHLDSGLEVNRPFLDAQALTQLGITSFSDLSPQTLRKPCREIVAALREFLDCLWRVYTGLSRADHPCAGATTTELEPLDKEIDRVIAAFGLTPDCRMRLRDGTTGEEFLNPVNVGLVYVCRSPVSHYEVMHFEASGVLSRLPGSKGGGHTLASDTVLGLAAHGAAYTIQELANVKSDDLNGRDALNAIYDGGAISPVPSGLSSRSLELLLRACGLHIEVGTYPSPKS